MIGMISTVLARHAARKKMPMVVAGLPIRDAIGIDFESNKKTYYTRCEIVAFLGTNTARLPMGYSWNGADVPRLFWSIVGVSKEDKRVAIASGFHDLGTEDDETPQVVADSNFISLLKPFRFVQKGNGGHDQPGVGRVRAATMYMAVRCYSIFVRPLLRLIGRKKIEAEAIGPSVTEPYEADK